METSDPQDNVTSDRLALKINSVIGYIRSPKRGDPKLDEWETQMRNYAEEHGYDLVEVLREDGISGVSTYRPALEQLLHSLENGDYVGVLVPYLAHFGVGNAATRIFNCISEIAWIECFG